MFSNLHTPLIAHTADDSLTIYTGLYGDRHGQPLTNSYKTYNPDGTTDPADSFTYWTVPISTPQTNAGPPNTVDTTPSMAYSDTCRPRSATPAQTPAPWVPFTRAGCTVGNFSTANMVLENTGRRRARPSSARTRPRRSSTAADPDNYKDPETAEYVGVAMHCAKGAAICAARRRRRPARRRSCRPSRGGYHGYQALFGAKYIAPAIGGGPDHDAQRLPGHRRQRQPRRPRRATRSRSRLRGTPASPGSTRRRRRASPCIADMQEAGIPVTYGYISDLHENKAGHAHRLHHDRDAATAGRPVGPGDSCYVDERAALRPGVREVLPAAADDGITPANTLFVISSEENDQFAGANVGRAIRAHARRLRRRHHAVQLPDGHDRRAAGEHQGPALRPSDSATTQFDIEPQGASIYVQGNPAADNPAVRQLERDTAAMTNPHDPYSGVDNEKIVHYQAGALEQRVLHMQTDRPAALPDVHAVPEARLLLLDVGSERQHLQQLRLRPRVLQPEHRRHLGRHRRAGRRGQRRRRAGAGGREPAERPELDAHRPAGEPGRDVGRGDRHPADDAAPARPQGRLPVRRPRHHAGARDRCRVRSPRPRSSPPAYDQIESSVGQFATDTLIADTQALASGSGSDDSAYQAEQATLLKLATTGTRRSPRSSTSSVSARTAKG